MQPRRNGAKSKHNSHTPHHIGTPQINHRIGSATTALIRNIELLEYTTGIPVGLHMTLPCVFANLMSGKECQHIIQFATSSYRGWWTGHISGCSSGALSSWTPGTIKSFRSTISVNQFAGSVMLSMKFYCARQSVCSVERKLSELP